MSPAKKEILKVVLSYAQERFLSFRRLFQKTNKSRMLTCEIIFKNAQEPDYIFIQCVRAELKKISDRNSKLKISIEQKIRQYPISELQNSVNSVDSSAGDGSPLRSIQHNSSVELDNLQANVPLPPVSILPVTPSSVPARSIVPLSPVSIIPVTPASVPPVLIDPLPPMDVSRASQSSFARKLVPPKNHLDVLIKAFEDETDHLQKQDRDTLVIILGIFLGIIGGLKHLTEINNSESFVSALPFVIYRFAMDYILDPVRSELSRSQQKKLFELFDNYKVLTKSGEVSTNNRDVIKILKAIAPYIETANLTPWVHDLQPVQNKFTQVSQAFLDIIARPPHNLYFVKPLLKLQSLKQADVAIEGADAGVRSYVVENVVETRRRLNQRKVYYQNKYHLIDCAHAFFTLKNYGLASPNEEHVVLRVRSTRHRAK